MLVFVLAAFMITPYFSDSSLFFLHPAFGILVKNLKSGILSVIFICICPDLMEDYQKPRIGGRFLSFFAPITLIV